MRRWLKWTTVIIVLFLVTFIWIRCAEADTIFEAAPATAFIGGDHHVGLSVFMTERFLDHYDIGVILMSEQTCDCGDNPGNLGIQAQRIVRWRALELGLGAAYWQNQTKAFTSNTAFSLSIGLHFGNWSVRHRHYSTGGASGSNHGLDLLTIGYSFR